jgi:hypothetical protein
MDAFLPSCIRTTQKNAKPNAETAKQNKVNPFMQTLTNFCCLLAEDYPFLSHP